MRPFSYADVASTLALVVALSGGAYAVTQLPSKSVGTEQLKNGSVTSKKVRNGSLKAKDLRAGVWLPPGAGVRTGPVNLANCAENILLSRTLSVKAPARLLGIGTGYWYANQQSDARYTVDSYLQLRKDGAIVGTTAKTGSESTGVHRASLANAGVLLDAAGSPAVLAPGRPYTVELVARTGGECTNQPQVMAAELSYVVLANGG